MFGVWNAQRGGSNSNSKEGGGGSKHLGSPSPVQTHEKAK